MSELKCFAYWSHRLHVDCPQCDYYIDITELSDRFGKDFWSQGIQPGEYGTPSTEDYPVECPECKCGFVVDFDR